MLTEQAIRAISDATIIFGSKRAIALVEAHIPAGCLVREMVTFSPSQSIPDNAVILSTGDPQLAGLGYLGGEIIPGISSLQIAAARLHIPLEQISVVIAHGKDHGPALDRIADEVRCGQITFIIADPKFSITALCAALLGTGEDISIAVCEDLGYPGEKIRIGSIARPPQPDSRLFSVMVGRIECSSGDQKSH